MITDTRVPCWLVGLVVLCWTPAARAIDDPSFDFKTLTTPHFYVHYEQRLRPLARRSARLAEQAHADLAPLLGHRPEKRTHVVLDDRVDLANGSANVFGRNVVKLYATPPAPDGVLGYYNDWLKVLIYHEYVHILHLDTRGEVLPWTDYLLGKQFHPNAVLPGWYVEGLAVLEESRLTGTGRNNSALFQMWLRTAALSDRFFSLGTATGLPEAWPQGTAPYLYGGAFTDYIADAHGQSFFRTFNHRYGRRIIPFALNKTAEDISGKTFHRLWKEWTAAEYGRAVARTIRVEAEGGTELEYLTEGGNLHRYPRMRPGTRQVSFYKSDLETNERFAVVEHGDTRVRTLHPAEGVTGSADWTPDGETLVYGRQTVYGSTYTYQDLYAWHAESDSVVRMTRKERARDPAVSPDGDRLAYVRNRRGTMDLVVCARTGTELNDCRAVAGGAVTDPGTRRHWQQISGPTWAPDGGAVVFSRWQLDTGRRDLWRWNRKSGELQQLTDDRAQQLDPTFGPDGSLYYASDRTGIFNIYRRRRPTGESHRVSNVVRGVFHPRVSPNGEWIYVSAYTDDGYELARFEHPVSGADARSTTANTEKQPAPPDVSTESWSTGDYRPGRWLGPLILVPQIAGFNSGSGMGAILRAHEPVGHHDWSANISTINGPTFSDYRLEVGASYEYTGGPIDLGLAARVSETPRTRSLFAEDRYIPFVERSYEAELSLSRPFSRIDESLSISLAFRPRFTDFRDEPAVDPEPTDREPVGPDQGWFNELRLSLSYGNFDRYAQSISTQRGAGGSVSLSSENEILGSDYESLFLTYSGFFFQPNPFLDRHVLALRLQGGIAQSELPTGRFGIGGHEPQDVLTGVLFNQPGGQFVLRGYPPQFTRGNQFQIWSVSYRFPILRLDKGFSTVPVFFKRIKGSVFADTGGAFDELLSDAHYRTGVGAEILVESLFAYHFSGNLRLGYAKGLTKGGIDEWYVLYGGGF